MIVAVLIVRSRRIAVVRGAVRVTAVWVTRVLVVVIPVRCITRITGPGVVVVAGVGSRSGWVSVAGIIVVRIGIAVSVRRAIET